ncbi:mariner Mos1 transposase [Trichonephila clavipes]|nr:mariner Mos1 transposase [Trichonephila clavipes]
MNLQINRKPVRQIVSQNLEMTKACRRLVPHHFTDDQKQARLEVSRDFVETADASPNFLNCIFTEDESCFRYDPETEKAKHRMAVSCIISLEKEQKNHASKRCSSPFLIAKALSTRNFYPRKRRCHFMNCLLPQYPQQGPWLFAHHNARPYTANIFKQFLAKKEVWQIEHLPYSPNLNPPDFFLFKRLKLALKG